MNGIDTLASQLQKTIIERDKAKKTGYDTQASVVRVDDNLIWVKIPGGVEETPVSRTQGAKVGDTVQVRVAGGRAWIVGNYTAPATDDTRAIEADSHAAVAQAAAFNAQTSANEAQESAATAWARANDADEAANHAQISADDAKASAIAANIASNSALTQLSVVEDVASVLTWISEHGTYKPSEDTAVISGKLYFTRSGTDPDYEYTLITEPTGDPSDPGRQGGRYYEIDTLGDESVSNYISSHLALTNAGLWVVNDNNSYKILLAGGQNAGMHVYDNYGNLVVSYGESIEFSNSKEFHIGNQNAYIIFNPANDGSITIGGSNINIGDSRTLDQVLAELDSTFIFDTTYEITTRQSDEHTVATFMAHVYKGGIDIVQNYPPEQFHWYLKHENTPQEGVYQGDGYTWVFDLQDCNYGAEVIAKFETLTDSPLLTGNDDNLTDINDTPITGRTESGESVRVRDLYTSTVIFPTEKLMVIGAEDEHLVSMETIVDHIWDDFNIQIENQPLQKGNNNYENIGLLNITNSELESILRF